MAVTGTQSGASTATDGVVTLRPHPHELTRSKPGMLSCQCRACCCSACKQRIPNRLPRYRCRKSDKGCASYVLCEACFNLGPGEGGLVRSASFNDQDAEFPLEVSADKKDRPVPLPQQLSSRSIADDRSTPSVASAQSEDGGGLPTEPSTDDVKSWLSEGGWDTLPPRIAASSHNFGLELDESAQERWASFAQPDGDGGTGGNAVDRDVQLAAKQVAPNLRFLHLTVLSRGQLYEEQMAEDKTQCMELYSPYSRVRPQLKHALLTACLNVLPASRSVGALVGLALGDSLGAPFEFIDAVDAVGSSHHMFNLVKFKNVGARNKFKVKPGQWTDDTSMALCLADTLLANGRYVGSDSRVRYHNWWFRGYNNAFGNDPTRIGSVGLGGNVAKSLRAMKPNEIPSDTYGAKSEDAGNGTLMRLAPVPIFFSEDPKLAALRSAESSAATHPGPIAAAACSFLGYAIARAIWREDAVITPMEFIELVVDDFTKFGKPGADKCSELDRLLQSEEPRGSKEECWNWKAPALQVESSLAARGACYNGYPSSADYFGSYCIDGLSVAMWSFCHTDSFTAAIARCTNFLGDSDTTSAICGQLAGAFYGYQALDPRMLKSLDRWDNGDIACRAALLYATRNRTARMAAE